MVVKRNQTGLYDDLRVLFDEAPGGSRDDRESSTTWEHAHGRYETRTLSTSSQLRECLRWPGVE